MENIKADKLRYQTNSIGYLLVMLSVVVSVIALFTLITYDNYGTLAESMRVKPDFRIGIEIAIGIVLMLATFLAAEKIKYYSETWGFYGLFVLAGINLVRIFNVPMVSYNNNMIPLRTYITTVVVLAASAALLIAAGIITIKKIIILKHHLKELEKNGEITV